MNGPFRSTPSGLEILVHVQPNARQTKVAGRHGDAIKIKVAAPARDDGANAELCRFLAEIIDVPRNRIELTSGMRGRRKRIRIKDVEANDTSRMVAALTPVAPKEEKP